MSELTPQRQSGPLDEVHGNRSKIFFGLFRVFLLLAAACAAAIPLAGMIWYPLAGIEVCLLCGLGFYILYKKQHHGAAISFINTTAARIEDTQLKLVAFNQHIHALNRFTNAFSEVADPNEVCRLVTRMLVEDFKFDSSQFWVLDSRQKRLECISASGYSAEKMRQYFSPKGATGPAPELSVLLNRVLEKGKTLAVSDAMDTPPDGNEEIRLFSRRLNLSSFVVTPLRSADRAIGVLTAEYQNSAMLKSHDVRTVEFVSRTASEAVAKDELKILGKKDCLLVESLSNVLGDALVKIELFHDMENQIEQRTRKLQRINEELLKTKELAIQSEKLSSLGRMAAGVIHQINDPLNFLVNIIPDLRNDFEGLEKAKRLIDDCVSDANVKAEIGAISKKYDLNSHLDEMNFVFERAIKALDKTTRIAKRLTVFTSDSDQEKVEAVDLLEAARETIEMIPPKLKGDTIIEIHGNEPFLWPVNAGEIQQVFINLVNNAIAAMDRKGKIDIRGHKDSRGVAISVCDNGPGIAAGIKNKIFDPFFTTKPAGQSTGLGLSISAEIVRKFGGVLTVESEQERGTCFYLTFHH